MSTHSFLLSEKKIYRMTRSRIVYKIVISENGHNVERLDGKKKDRFPLETIAEKQILNHKRRATINNLLLSFGYSTFGLMELVPLGKQLQHVFCRIKFI